jgi:hypothetical protein
MCAIYATSMTSIPATSIVIWSHAFISEFRIESQTKSAQKWNFLDLQTNLARRLNKKEQVQISDSNFSHAQNIKTITNCQSTVIFQNSCSPQTKTRDALSRPQATLLVLRMKMHVIISMLLPPPSLPLSHRQTHNTMKHRGSLWVNTKDCHDEICFGS